MTAAARPAARGARALRRAVLGAFALVLAALGIACLVYPPVYVFRVLAWQDSDVDDRFRFPKRDVHPAPGAADLPVALDEARVRLAFAALRPGHTLESWLEAQHTQGFVVLHRDYGVPPGQWMLLFEQLADRRGAAPAPARQP